MKKTDIGKQFIYKNVRSFRNNTLTFISIVGDKLDDKVGDNLTENQQQILQSMTVQPSITANELANIVKISKRKIEENIAKLKQKGIIQRIGPDKGGYWKVELKH